MALLSPASQQCSDQIAKQASRALRCLWLPASCLTACYPAASTGRWAASAQRCFMSKGMRERWPKIRGWGVSPASPGPFWRQKNWKVELWCQCHRGRLQQHLPCSTKGFALTSYFKHHPMTIISFSPLIEQISEFKQSRYCALISNVINMAAN